MLLIVFWTLKDGSVEFSNKIAPYPGGGGALGYCWGGYVSPGTPNWHPVLEKISPKIDTTF